MDGWNTEALENVIDVCDRIYELTYELKNCVKGAYTGCDTYAELGKYIQRLGEELADEGNDVICNKDYLEDLDNEDDEDDDEDEDD